MITIEQGIKISAIIDKMGIKMPVNTKDQSVFGADLMMQVIRSLHKAKNEVYALIAELKGCTAAEAKEVNLIEFIKELGEIAGLKDFLSSAVTSQTQD